MNEQQPVYTENELLEVKAQLEAVQSFFATLHPSTPINNPVSENDFAWAIEDIDSYIAHQIHGEPYPEEE